MKIEDLAFDREKTLNWWTGRITNLELAQWTGQAERDVRLILDAPFMKRQIQGGGRGSKNTRRIPPTVRNAVAIVAALRKAGLSIEAATNMLDAFPVLASFPTESIDLSPNALEFRWAGYGGVVMLQQADPDGGWLPTDTVPSHVFHRHCRPIVKNDRDIVTSTGQIGWLPRWREEQFGIPTGWKSFGDPLYRPEIDTLGIYEFGNTLPDSSDTTDHHFYIVDGCWIWARYHNVHPRDYLIDIFQKFELGQERRYDDNDISFDFEAIAEFSQSHRKTVAIRGDEKKEALAAKAWEQYRTKLDINASLAVREMKRVALGLIASPDTS